MWQPSEIGAANEFVERLRLNLSRVEVSPTAPVIDQLIAALANDLDTQKVLKVLKNWCEATEVGGSGGSAGELARVLDELLGLAF
jgi:L-cysteine:1D-myo-inositol 2-amino-2-deoxy-alpha-D-glucopyranoside ligase